MCPANSTLFFCMLVIDLPFVPELFEEALFADGQVHIRGRHDLRTADPVRSSFRHAISPTTCKGSS